MSSIDQAFVKAFARRNRPSQTASSNETKRPQPDQTTRPKPTTEAPIERRVLPAKPLQHSECLRIDPSVDASVELFSDPSENRLVRVDSLRRDVIPSPHAAPTSFTTDPSVPGSDAPSAPSSPPPDRPRTGAPRGAIPMTHPDDLAESSTQPIDHVRSIQDSLDLLQHTFNTLDASAQATADEGIVQAFAEEVITASPPTSIDAPARPQPPSHPTTRTDTVNDSGIVQQRIDTPVDESSAPTPTDEEIEPVSASDDGDTSEPDVPQLRPAWEVDVFDVPGAVADLFFDGPLFQQVAERILQAVNSGLTSMMVTSAHRGEGRSTVAIGMAMAAAAAGLRVALVDADTEEPTLIDDLRLELQYGWVDTVRGGVDIREVAVHAVEDGVTFIPLMPPAVSGSAATEYETAQLLEMLRGKFDLIVVDTPSQESSTNFPAATAIDSALIVRDPSRSGDGVISRLSDRLRAIGVQGIGVVDNFA